MIIQINTDKNVSESNDRTVFLTELISEELSRFNEQITRVEVHLSDEDGKKDGQKDKRCLIEARLEGRQPIAVTDQAGSHEEAVSGAIDKLKTSLKTIRGRLRNY